MSAREELLAQARQHMWAAWQLSSEELASQAASTLLGLGMLVPEGGAAELEQLRAECAEAADTVAQLVQELVHRVKVEHAFRDEVERLRARASELEKQRERRRARLVALQNDVLSIRGSLAPADGDRKVPFELGETLTPAVDWLIARVAELEARLDEYERPVDEDPIAYALTEQVSLTIYRASHDSIGMGLYTTREAAQAHCEAKVQQEEPAESILHLSWTADDIDPDAEYELHITPAETGGLIRGTGYVVTPLEVAAAYDEEADQ